MTEVDVQNAEASYSNIAQWLKLPGEGVSVATFAGFSEEGHFLIRLDDEPKPMHALSTIGLSERDRDLNVVVAFEGNNVRFPIIIGRLHESKADVHGSSDVYVDGERIVFKAERELELRCGEASIVLTRAGKVLIKGNFVLSRSRGANKIKGAYIDIN